MALYYMYEGVRRIIFWDGRAPRHRIARLGLLCFDLTWIEGIRSDRASAIVKEKRRMMGGWFDDVCPVYLVWIDCRQLNS